jgi:hypothetical protein
MLLTSASRTLESITGTSMATPSASVTSLTVGSTRTKMLRIFAG